MAMMEELDTERGGKKVSRLTTRTKTLEFFLPTMSRAATSPADAANVVQAQTGNVKICLDFIHNYYSHIQELWLPPPYGLCVNYGGGVMGAAELHVFASDEARFAKDDTSVKNVCVSRAFAEQCRAFVAARTAITATTCKLLGLPAAEEEGGK
jgi:hypothetical protein